MREKRRWSTIKAGCLNPNSPAYKYFGAKGIAIDKRWLVFENFLRDVGRFPPGKTLVQIDKTKNFGPKNWQFISLKLATSTKLSHGRYGTKEYTRWCNMIARCYDTKSIGFKYYGGRGIKVCDRWRSFANYFNDLGQHPKGMSVDRIDNNGPYSPENCRFASKKTQSENRRCVRWVDVFKERLTYRAFYKKFGVAPATLKKYLALGFSAEEIVIEKKRRSTK